MVHSLVMHRFVCPELSRWDHVIQSVAEVVFSGSRSGVVGMVMRHLGGLRMWVWK